MSIKTDIRRLPDNIKRYFKLGTDRRRGFYERTKRLLNASSFALRRRAAEGLSADAAFTIPRERGFTGLTGEHVEEIPEIVHDARRRLAGRDPTATRQPRITTRGLFVHQLDSRQLTLGSAVVRFALRRDVIGAVARYLGFVPVLGQIDLWFSEAPDSWNNSQLYHCDWSATTQIKIFVYCSDVDISNGPLTVVEAQTSRSIRARLKYDYVRNGNRYRVSDAQMERLGGLSARHALLGTAGTTYFVDTSQCFHYGSRVATGARPRIVVLFQLLPPSAFQLPLDFRLGAPLRHLSRPDLPLYQRLVLGSE